MTMTFVYNDTKFSVPVTML